MDELINKYQQYLNDAISGQLEVRGDKLGLYISFLNRVIFDLKKLKEKQNEDRSRS
jgi:hypothetical protein